jgi:hypothetical protein
LDDERTANRHVSIAPRENLVSQSDMIGQWEKTTGLKLKRNSVPASALEAAIKDLSSKPDKMLEMIFTQLTRACWILGMGNRKRPEALEATELYPEVKYERVAEFIERFHKH